MRQLSRGARVIARASPTFRGGDGGITTAALSRLAKSNLATGKISDEKLCICNNEYNCLNSIYVHRSTGAGSGVVSVDRSGESRDSSDRERERSGGARARAFRSTRSIVDMKHLTRLLQVRNGRCSIGARGETASDVHGVEVARGARNAREQQRAASSTPARAQSRRMPAQWSRFFASETGCTSGA